VERGLYGAQLQRLYTLFPRQQVLVLNSEVLDADPQAVLGQVTDFLGVPRFAGPITPRRSHVGHRMDHHHLPTAEDRALLRGVYDSDQRRFAELGGTAFLRST
jgi:hypothetical protein